MFGNFYTIRTFMSIMKLYQVLRSRILVTSMIALLS